MLLRCVPVICVLTLSASAQPPTSQPSSSRASLCEKIASIAFEANRGLQAGGLTDGRKTPFVSSWLVQNGLRPAGDTEFSRLGAVRDCDGPVTQGCYQRQSDEWDLPPREAGADLPKPGVKNIDDYVRWVSLIGLLPVNGEFLEVMGEPEHGPFNYNYPSGAFVKSVLDRNGLMCTFDSRLHESYSPQNPETKQSCAALLSDGSEVVEPDLDVPAGITPATFRADRQSTDPFFWDFYPLGALKLDVDGDGTLEHLIKVTGVPGHGRCRGKTYYDVLDSSDPTKFSTAPVRELVRNVQSSSPPCGYEIRIRRTGNRVLFEVAGSGLGAVKKQGVPIMAERAGLLSRELREISTGEVKYLCSTVFSVEPVVVYAR